MKTTVNQSEIEHFGKLAEQWWAPNSPLHTLKLMNQVRVPFVESTINREMPGRKRILDLGSGGGFLSEGLGERFHELGWRDDEIEIVGMEPATESVQVAKAHLPENLAGKVSYVCDTIENFSAQNPNEKFDTVVMSEVIEHVDNPEEFLKYAVSVVKPGGSVILTTPSKTFLSWLGVIICAEYILRKIPIGTHEYSKFLSQEQTVQLLKTYGCEVKDVRGLMFNPITGRYSWSNFKSFCYAVHAIKSNA